MLSMLALSVVLLQEPPAPPPPPEARTRVFVRSTGDGPGLDRDGDGQVTREEFSAPMGEAFAGLDKDGNGRLSTEELSAGPREDVFVSGPGGSGPHRIELRRSGGSDDDVIILGGPGGPHGPMAWSRHDGPGESRVEIRRMDGVRPGDLDKDGDGKVSEAEFTAPLRDAFARLDADRSGFVEEGERGRDGDVRVITHRIERRDGGED